MNKAKKADTRATLDNERAGRAERDDRSDRSGSSGAAMTVRHIWFDYHKKCAKGRTHAIGEIIEILDPFLKDGSYIDSLYSIYFPYSIY